MLFGIYATLAGALLMAFLRTMERKYMALKSDDRKVDDSILAVIRSCGALFLGLIIWVAKDGASMNFHDGFWNAILITGLLNIFILIFGLKALGDKDTDMTLSVPVMDTTPAAIIFLSWVILGQWPTYWGYRGIAVLGASAYLLNITNHVNKSLDGKWNAKVFFAPWKALQHRGMRFAVGAAVLGSIAINYDGMAALSGPFIGLSLVVLPSLLANLLRAVKNGAIRQIADEKRMNLFLLVIYPIGWGLTLASFWYSLGAVIVPYQATLKRAETLFVFFFAFFLLSEKKNVLVRFIATIGIITGAALITVSV